MFGKKHRLQKTKDVQFVFARGRAFFSPFFLAKYKKVAGEKKFTVVVSTKVHKRAVVRNRIKRLVRETLKLNMGNLPEGFYVITAKPKVMEIYDAGIVVEVSKLLEKIALPVKNQ